MATSTKRQRSNKRRKDRQGSTKKRASSQVLYAGIAILIIALLAFGTFQLFGNNQPTGASVLQTGNGSIEALDINSSRQEGVDVAPVTDRETQFLGPASDAATVALAEAGELGQPTLVWFHADW